MKETDTTSVAGGLVLRSQVKQNDVLERSKAIGIDKGRKIWLPTGVRAFTTSTAPIDPHKKVS